MARGGIAKNLSPDPAAARLLCGIVQTKAEARCSLPQRGASLGLASRPAARFISHWLLQPTPKRSPDKCVTVVKKSPPQGRVTEHPGGRAGPETVNNLILNFQAGGVLLLFNSRGRPRRTRALRALIVSAISTRCWRPRRWEGPGIRSGAFPRPRSRNPFPLGLITPLPITNKASPRAHSAPDAKMKMLIRNRARPPRVSQWTQPKDAHSTEVICGPSYRLKRSEVFENLLLRCVRNSSWIALHGLNRKKTISKTT